MTKKHNHDRFTVKFDHGKIILGKAEEAVGFTSFNADMAMMAALNQDAIAQGVNLHADQLEAIVYNMIEDGPLPTQPEGGKL